MNAITYRRIVLQRVAFVCVAILLPGFSTIAPADVALLWEDDFETNLDPVSREPDGWEQLFGKGYPEYNQIIFPDNETVRSGNASVRFRLLGGNMAMEHMTFLPITPGRTYRACAWIRTAGLRKSVAYFSLQIYDKKGFPLGHYVYRSNPVEGTSDWVLAEVKIERPGPDAAFMRARCTVEGGDISGSAWFDHIRLFEQAWIELDTSPTPRLNPAMANSGNIFEDSAPAGIKPRPIRAIVKIRGAEAGDQLVEVRCSDFMGNPVAEPILQRIRVDKSGNHDLPVEIALMKRGYTRVEVSLFKKNKDGTHTITGSHRTSVGILDPWLLQFPKTTWLGSDINPYWHGARDLVSLMKLARMRRTRLRVWNEFMPPLDSAMASAELDAVLAACASAGIEPIGELGTPSVWARRATFSAQDRGGQSLFLLDESVWRQPLATTLGRLKTHVSKWLLGTPGVADFSRNPLTATASSKLADTVKSIIRFPELGVPVSADASAGSAMPPLSASDGFAFVTVHIPPNLPPELIPAAISQFDRSASKRYVNIALQPIIEPATAGPKVPQQLSDMARRLAAVRAAGVSEAFITPMTDESRGLVDEFGKPTAAFYTLLVMNRTLSNKTFDPRQIFSRNVAHMIFRGTDESVILFWRAPTAAANAPSNIPVGFGTEARVLTLDGHLAELKRERDLAFVKVDEIPQFIVGINPAFLDTQLSVAIEPPAIECAEGIQRVAILVSNAFPDESISNVDIRVDFPQEWTVTHSMRTIPHLPPGGVGSLASEVSIPPREVLGTKEIPITIHFMVNGKKYAARVIRPLRLKSELETSLELERTKDGTVSALVLSLRNVGHRFVDAKCYVQAPGVPEREIPMRALAPASVRVRRIPLSIRPNTHGTIYVHVVEEGGRRLFLNDRIEY